MNKYLNKKVHVVINDPYHSIDADGIVTYVDDAGQLHGTWGGLAAIPGEDSITIIGPVCCVEEWWGQCDEDPYQVAKRFNLLIEKIEQNYDETFYRFSGTKSEIENAQNHGYFWHTEEIK